MTVGQILLFEVEIMRLWKNLFLFAVGGCSYMTMEFLWRGWSHGSMFLAGGTCFLLLGRLERLKHPPAIRALEGAAVITAVELITGLITNADHRVWDYRDQLFNYRGQICLGFSLLWIPISLGGMVLYRLLDTGVERKMR